MAAAVGTPAPTQTRIAAAAGREPVAMRPLSGGCNAEVRRVEFAEGAPLVAKLAPEGGLALEAWMLAYLAEHSRLPVPRVVLGDDDLLLMTWIEGGGALDDSAEEHAADLLAELHGVTQGRFGMERDTLIGPLAQPNGEMDDWRDFFAERRLVYMGRLARDSGHLPAETLRLVESVAKRLPDLIDPPHAPSLVHGDMWGGNVLARGGRIAGFVDPAIYYADAEVELAFATLFGTFGEPFFRRYRELRPLSPDFFELRRDVYNLYPLLVHTALFGGHYGASVRRIAERFA
ncbi:MAG: fructosamine kinase family protein [Rhodovibrionaceae bacterium]|nr:fructosamine kinase family protein [Rhodovibrionaceae bacterium]